MKGAGHVATGVIHHLLQKRAKHVLVSDVDMKKIETAEKGFDKDFKDGRITFKYTERNDHSILFEGESPSCNKRILKITKINLITNRSV